MPIKFVFNFDLIGIAFTIAASVILGFSIFIRNKQSATHLYFFLFCLTNAIWALLNYFSYQAQTPIFSLWTIRSVLFTAVWHAYLFFSFAATFPEQKNIFTKKFILIITAAAIFVSLLVLSPAVVSGVKIVPGSIAQLKIAAGMPVFGLTIILFIGAGIFQLVRKIKRASGKEKFGMQMIFVGFLIMFVSILALNFISPVVLSQTVFIGLSGIVTLPFLIMTAYSFMKYEFLDVKVISTEILVALLATAILLDLALAESLSAIILRGVLVVVFLIVGVLLIRSVFREVEQRHKLQLLNNKLQELDQLKSQFLSFASHQLREPLSAIRILSKLLLQGYYGDLSQQLKEKVGQISRSAERLIRLSDDFLNLRRLEEGRMEYHFSSVKLATLLKSLMAEFEPILLEKRLTLTLQPVPEQIFVWADDEKLWQVISNLIDNGTKYTKEGGITINVSEKPDKKSAIITIHDTGMGIDKDVIPTLFEQFKRDKSARTIRGTGLGLYIAKRIINDQKGDIWVESEGEGKGSTFFVEVPISSPQSPTPPPLTGPKE